VRLYHFTTRGGADLIKEHGEWGITVVTPWLGPSRSGVDLADGFVPDAYSGDTSWLVVVDIDEDKIRRYEIPRTKLMRDLLARVTRGRRCREWLVPYEVLDKHADVVEIGDFHNSQFAARYAT
jgi:hypothetical protein